MLIDDLAPLKQSLHLLACIVLERLPVDAHILCVGAGVGEEVLFLAQAFPRWRFTAVDPCPAVLQVCRARVADRGLETRCDCHSGYVSDLCPETRFEGATCFLVSHLLTEPEQRRALFRSIRQRLLPEGLLVGADLTRTKSVNDLLPLWRKILELSALTDQQVEEQLRSLGREKALLTMDELSGLVTEAGFQRPVPFHQTLLARGWFAKPVR